MLIKIPGDSDELQTEKKIGNQNDKSICKMIKKVHLVRAQVKELEMKYGSSACVIINKIDRATVKRYKVLKCLCVFICHLVFFRVFTVHFVHT